MDSITIFTLVLCPCLLHLLLDCRNASPLGVCLLVAVLPLCHALPLTPGDSAGQRSSPLLMLTLCCPQSLVGWYPWVLRHAVGHLRQPWDPRDRARQEPPVGARCPVTPVDGMISGYDYDYDYDYDYALAYLYVDNPPTPLSTA